MSIPVTIGVVGATGIVGQTALDVLLDNFEGFKPSKVRVFASKSSAGKRIPFGTGELTVEETNLANLSGCDVVFFASDASIALEFIPSLAERGVLCIDKSSAYRENPAVPLVVPEVNAHTLDKNKLLQFPVVANPNCCATPLVLLLKPLYEKFGLERVIVSTYQSVSGAGKAGIDVLREECQEFFRSEDLSNKASSVFPKSIAFNVMPFVAKILPSGDTDEEAKIISETRRLLDLPTLRVAATSVRVPTFVGHAEAVTIEFSKKTSVEELQAALASFPGVRVVKETGGQDEDDVTLFPTPREIHGKDEMFVGRIRRAQVFDNGFSFWIACDNLRKGAALNAIQILDTCARNGVLEALMANKKKA